MAFSIPSSSVQLLQLERSDHELVGFLSNAVAATAATATIFIATNDDRVRWIDVIDAHPA